MKIISIGRDFDNPLVFNCEYSSSISLLDFDLLIWDPNNMLNEYRYQLSSPKYMGYKNLDDDDSVSIVNDINRRKQEMNEMLQLGRTVVIFTPYPQMCYRATGEKQFSGTGKNRSTTRIVTELNLMSSLPIKINTTEATGENIDFKGKFPFDSFWKSNNNYFYYRAYFNEMVGMPLFFIKDTDKTIGTYVSVGKGHLLFLPSFVSSNTFKTKKEWKEVQNIFIDSLIGMIEELKKDKGDFNLPAWCLSYLVPNEEDEKKKLTDMEKDLADLLNTISHQKEKIAELEEYKILFVGSGKALEIQVGKIFEQLGFSVAEGLPGRDDLILKFNDKVAVVEVKGVSKSAAEKHAAQLEKWVSEYYASKGIMPKGILVVNAFKDIPLAERKEETFPHQMLDYSKKRGHCLVTSLQLLCSYIDFLNNPSKKEEIINSLFETEGAFDNYKDWNSYIKDIGEEVNKEVKE